MPIGEHQSNFTKPQFTLAERLEFGSLTIPEICELAQRSRTSVYEDIAAGLLTVEKVGRSSRVRGPNAKRYLSGQTAAARAAADKSAA